MPTYPYRCDYCGEFEVDQRITDEPLERCPNLIGPHLRKRCKEPVVRMIAKTSFRLKGGGWSGSGYSAG